MGTQKTFEMFVILFLVGLFVWINEWMNELFSLVNIFLRQFVCTTVCVCIWVVGENANVCARLISIWCSCMNLVSFYHFHFDSVSSIRNFGATMTTLFCRSTAMTCAWQNEQAFGIVEKYYAIEYETREREWAYFPFFNTPLARRLSHRLVLSYTRKLARFRYTARTKWNQTTNKKETEQLL